MARRAPSVRQPPHDVASEGKRGEAVVAMIWVRKAVGTIK
jgi:hypothetical protein